jgi:hypothetical protein
MGKVVDWLFDFIYALAAAVLNFLPTSPFQAAGFKDALSTFSGLMSNINYFIPFGSMFTMMSLYVAAALIWYGIRWILRLAQYIE